MQLNKFNKTSLKDLNVEEARGWTIDRLQQIEKRIDTIIISYFGPKDKTKFERIVLNSSIMDLGSKLKVLRNINTVDKKTIDEIRTLASIRNGFAHAPIFDEILLTVDKNNSEHFDTVVYSVIEVMNAQGEIKTKKAYDYLVEFWELNNSIRAKLDVIKIDPA